MSHSTENQTEQKTENKTEQAEQPKMLKLSFAAAEAYKLLRTNVLFSLPDEDKGRVVGITSAMRGEGKSTTAVNLSYALAQIDKKVLLIDADMRLPSVAKKLGMANTYGLSNILVDSSERVALRVSRFPTQDNWHILTSGEIPPNPSELLSSERMKSLIAHFSERYDFIIVDLPPVNIVTDALVAAPFLSGMIVVVREDQTERKALNSCVRDIRMADTKLLGFVMNGAKEKGKAYGRYKKYYKYYAED